jgi:coenzyme F420 biosynthesis associated uncharacterized protein
MGVDGIDWSIAQRIAEMVGGSPSYHPQGAQPDGQLAQDFARRVSSYSGLALTQELPALETVDRSRWIEANLQNMRPLLEPVSDRLGASFGPLSGPIRSVSGALLGAQVGALVGMLSQRVLGQYDLALLDPSVVPRLLLVGPNLEQAAQNLEVDQQQLISWVTIHEITHAVQFSGTPWLAEHLAGLLRTLIDGLQVTIDFGQLVKLPDLKDMRDLLDRVRRGELLRLTLGEQRWQIVDRMQATMSLIEGHAEHVMDAVGADVLPSLSDLRTAMNRRRENRPVTWRILEGLLGIDLKLRQYEVGRRFCDVVVAQDGPSALARAFSAPEALPSTPELEAPLLWLARTT